ncbi:hypothetical protein [Marinicellulosiphila megalodicopiae]|uniref:hypothetical protein n=1 Tax=Marinicellulosiphila megalodicopiae TaxID=2724896 RepID=UPI003BB20AB4
MPSKQNYPCIVSFQSSDLSELSVPICLGWSLSDGQYKCITIIPEDEWLDGIDQGEYNLEDLFDFGVTAQDLIKELNQDCDKQIIYSSDPAWLDDVLNCLYSSIEQPHPFQIESVFDLFENHDYQTIVDTSTELYLELGLAPLEPEDQIKMWLHLYNELILN